MGEEKEDKDKKTRIDWNVSKETCEYILYLLKQAVAFNQRRIYHEAYLALDGIFMVLWSTIKRELPQDYDRMLVLNNEINDLASRYRMAEQHPNQMVGAKIMSHTNNELRPRVREFMLLLTNALDHMELLLLKRTEDLRKAIYKS